MQYPSKIYELSYTFHNDTTLFLEDTNGNITIYIKQNKFVGTWIGNKEIYISTRRRNMSVYITELTFTEDTVNMTTEGEKGIRNMSGTYTAEGNELIMKISFGSSSMWVIMPTSPSSSSVSNTPLYIGSFPSAVGIGSP